MAVRDCLKKSLFSLLMAGLVLVSINICGAQVLSAIPGIGSVDLSAVKVTSFAQAGYKYIGFNLNLPFQTTPVDQLGQPFGLPSLDLKFQDAGTWVGTIGIDARLLSNWFLTLKVDGNVSKNIRVVTGESMPYWWGNATPYDWSGSGLQWWDVDGMVGYTFCKAWSAVVGVRYDKLTVSLADPVGLNGNPVTFPGNIENYRLDVLVKTWIPYIGLQLDEPYYRAYLLYSPFASPQVTAPQSGNTYIPNPFTIGHNLYNYKFANTGSFLEAYIQYNILPRESLQFELWAKGTCMWFRGNGDWNFVESVEGNAYVSYLNPQSTSGSLNTSSLGVGIAASLSF